MEEAIKLRDLESRDIFTMSKIISKIGLKNFKECFNSKEIKEAIAKFDNKKSDDNTTAIGMIAAIDVANVLFEHLPDCEAEIYSFIADLASLKPEDIKALPIVNFMELIVEVIKKPEFKDFFKVASKLFK